MGKINSFKELVVWQKSCELAVSIYKLTSSFPSTEFSLTGQLRRSAISVPSNIAEGWSRNSTKEFVNFLHISRGSLAELETQLIISAEVGHINQESLNVIMNSVQEIGKMINSMISHLRVSSIDANR